MKLGNFWFAKRARVGVVALAMVVALGATSAYIGYAATAPYTFYSCLAGGALTRVSISSAPTCSDGQTAVSWNQIGPPGPTGPTGPQGPTGATGPAGPTGARRRRHIARDVRFRQSAWGRVARQQRVSQDRARWQLGGRRDCQHNRVQRDLRPEHDVNADANCELRSGSTVMGGATDRRTIPETDTVKRTLSMNGGAALPAGGEISLRCRSQDSQNERVDDAQLMITQVGGFL
jgi:hypothetical protein